MVSVASKVSPGLSRKPESQGAAASGMRREWPAFLGWYAVVVCGFPGELMIQRTVCPGSMRTPIGSNQTSAPRSSLRMRISTTEPAASAPVGRECAALDSARPASARPPSIRKPRRVSMSLPQRRGLLRGDVPEHDVVVRLRDARVPGVVVHVHVIDPGRRHREILELLMGDE